MDQARTSRARLTNLATSGAGGLTDPASQGAGAAGRRPWRSDRPGAAGGHLPFVALFTVFVLACFVGYYVVWRVTPALHSPLMAVTNAISCVIIVGALIAAGPGKIRLLRRSWASSP